jgi:geranylgeranyl diphosphate synthase type II
MTRSVEERLLEMKRSVENYLEKVLQGDDSRLYAAMRYAALSEGKRFRPLLLMASGQSFGASPEILLPFACALEFIHNYSLIHDDLPSMDNDDWRRGQPSCHRAFGEDVALLAGDSLLTLAFEVMSKAPVPEELIANKIAAIAEVSRQAGPRGMIAGQFLDISIQPSELTEELIFELMQKKTGALIVAAAKVGALLADASEEEVSLMESFGQRLGLAFQVRDDILDAGQSNSQLLERPNYAQLVGLDKARQLLKSLVQEAINLLQKANRLSGELEYLSLKLLDVA